MTDRKIYIEIEDDDEITPEAAEWLKKLNYEVDEGFLDVEEDSEGIPRLYPGDI